MNDAQLGFLVVYSLGMVLQILLPNYAGTNVVEHCERLANNAWSSDWFELEPVVKKSFSIVYARLQRSLFLRAGMFFQLNTETFIKVIKPNNYISHQIFELNISFIFYLDHENSLFFTCCIEQY